MNIAGRRFFAYLIDMFIIALALFLLKQVIPTNKYEIELNNLNEDLLEEKISYEDYFNQFKVLTHNIDKTNIGINVVNTVLLIVIFIVVPFVNNGTTIGQKLLKIKSIKDSGLQLEDLVGRAVIINGLGYMFFMFIILYLLPSNFYFIAITLLGLFQIIVVIVNAFMVLYSKDKKGIADKFTNTRIEIVKV